MSEEFIENLFSINEDNKSIGITNVNNRLKSIYGDEYGLEIESKVGRGTIVSMKIPKVAY